MQNEICKCPCHNSKYRVMHVIPCCVTCQHCGQHIVSHLCMQHQKTCIPNDSLFPQKGEDTAIDNHGM